MTDGWPRTCTSSSCINYMQYPWGYALPMSHIISTRDSYPQYTWGYAVPLSHILSTRESYPQYLWGYAVPVSHILSTVHVRICSTHELYPQYHDSYPQHLWGYAVPVSHILSTHEDMQYLWVISSVPGEDMQYLWVISSVPVRICSTHESYWTALTCFRNSVPSLSQNTRMTQKLSLLAVHLRQSLKVLEGLKVKTKYQPAL